MPTSARVSTPHKTLLPKRRRGLEIITRAVFCIAIVIVHLSAFQARGYDGPPVPDPQVLIDLVRDTILAVDAGNKSGSYSALHAMGSAEFQSSVPLKTLAEQFSTLRAANLDLLRVKSMTPLTTGSPTTDGRGKMRILGYFEFPERWIVYDLVYAYDREKDLWRISSLAITPRDLPETPDIMQPQ